MRGTLRPISTWFPWILAAAALPGRAEGLDLELDPRLREAEERRVALVERASPGVVAVFAPGGRSGGSGVLISADGFALTNYHVVGGSVHLRCGLPDGRLHDAVVVGLDPRGDVALIKLLGREEFPHSPLGDSDRVRVGDEVLAAGNPFLLATDFRPAFTLGVVSGVRRYQPPTADGGFEYTDCIQTDAAVNPGNSGGPLFNELGEVVGVNGRISLQKRGRVGVGVAYAISINQIKNFLDQLRGGWIVAHATIGATVSTEDDGRVVFDRILESSDAFRRGLRRGDELVSFAGRPIVSANDFQNALGALPGGWKVDLTYRRGQEKFSIRVRLEEARPAGERAPSASDPSEARRPRRPELPPHVAAVYEPKEGFANYFFNREPRDRLLAAVRKAGDFSKRTGDWKLVFDDDGREVFCTLGDREASWRTTEVSTAYRPGEVGATDPPGSGGLLAALEQWRRLASSGEAWFSQCDFAGSAPDANGVRMPVLATQRGGVACRWYFDPDAGGLIALECLPEPNADPCEIHWSDLGPVGGFTLPRRWEVRRGDATYAILTLKVAEFSP